MIEIRIDQLLKAHGRFIGWRRRRVLVIRSFASKVSNGCWIRVSTTCGSGWVNPQNSNP